MSILKKKVEVIMLDTSDTNPVNVPFVKLPSTTRLSKHCAGGQFRKLIAHGATPQHLYFVSTEIIENTSLLNNNDYYYIKNHYQEWYIGKYNGKSFDFVNNQGNFDSSLFKARKVITTTDKSIILPERFPSFTYLPQPSYSFIDSYIKAFNEGNPIKYVMVEYEKSTYNDWIKTATPQPEYKIKTDKNNTITITRCKENYSAEEVNKILDSFAERFVANTDMAYKQKDIADWKTQNL